MLNKEGLKCAVVLNVILSIFASLSLHFKTGIFETGNLFHNIIKYNLFVFLQITLTLIIGSLLEEKKEYEKKLEEEIKKVKEEFQKQQAIIIRQNTFSQNTQIISMIAHQWRQPLNNISILSQLIVQKYKSNQLNDEFIEYFKTNSLKYIKNMFCIE